MERSIKELVKDAIEELIADNTIIIEDDNGNKINDLVLNVVHGDDDDDVEDDDFDNEEEDDNE